MSRKPGIMVRGTTSKLRVVLYSFLSSCSVILMSVVLQWVIYDDLLRDPGPLRLVGTLIASILAFLLVWQWQESLRRERVHTQKRLAVIAVMNDRIRNALQSIECITYAKDESATTAVREAVDVIDATLRDASLEITKASYPYERAAERARSHIA